MKIKHKVKKSRRGEPERELVARTTAAAVRGFLD